MTTLMPAVMDTYVAHIDFSETIIAAHVNNLQDAVNAIQKMTVGGIWVNAKGLGAAGDGITDDTVALQNALNGLNTAGGGVLYIPTGTYIVSGLTFFANIHILGAGINGTILKMKNSTNANILTSFGFAGLTGGDTTGGVNNFSVTNLTLDGNKTNNLTTGYGLQVYGYGYIIQNVRIHDCRQDGLYSQWSSVVGSPGQDGQEAHINGLKVHDCAGNGIQWNGPHDSTGVNVHIFSNAARGLWVAAKGFGLQIVNAHSWGTSHTYAYYLEAAANFTNCVAEGAVSAQVFLGANNIQWVGGLVQAGGAATPVGFVMGDGSHLSLTGNQIITKVNGCTGNAIQFAQDGGGNQVNMVVNAASGAVFSGTPNIATQREFVTVGGATGSVGHEPAERDFSAGISIFTKAGTPVDGDFASAVPALLAVDTTASKLWVRVGATWKSVALA